MKSMQAWKPAVLCLVAAGLVSILGGADAPGGWALKHTFKTQANVTSMALGGGDTLMASLFLNSALQRWDLKTGKPLDAVDLQKDIERVATSPDGKRVAAVGDFETVKLLDSSTCKQVAEVPAASTMVVSTEHVAWSGSGKSVVVVAGKKMKVSEVDGGKEIFAADVPEPFVDVKGLAFSPDGKSIAISGSCEGPALMPGIGLWDAATGKLTKTLKTNDAVGEWLIYLDNKSLVVPWSMMQIAVLDIETGKATRYFKIPEGQFVSFSTAALSNDGRYLAAGTAQGSAYVWDLKSGNLLATLKDHTDKVSAVAISSDGRLIVTGSHDKSIRVYEVK